MVIRGSGPSELLQPLVLSISFQLHFNFLLMPREYATRQECGEDGVEGLAVT